MKSLWLGSSQIKRQLFWLIALSAVARGVLAWILDLGSNEAYYWTYGAFPDISHLDHPPMIGWLIQLFTVNLALEGEFFLRLASIVIGSLNTWIVFIIGRRIRGERTGLFAALIYTASFYCSLIAGTFISPDTPQSLFILLSIYFFHEGLIVKYESCDETKTLCRIALMLAGIFIGLAMLSKYSSLFIWIGAFVYIISNKRKILKDIYLYLSVLISLLFLFPVFLWNIENNFISFAFQSSRLPILSSVPDFFSFIESLTWVIIYNNPVNIIIMIFAIINFKKSRYITASQFNLLLSLSLPIIIFFISVSLFAEGKANWSAPGFLPLIFIAAAFLDNNYKEKSFDKVSIPSPITNAISLLLISIAILFFHHFTGFLKIAIKEDVKEEMGIGDATLEYFGWRTLSKEFKKIREDDIIKGEMPEKCFILSSDWAQASHMNFYIAEPLNMVVKTIGELKDTRKFAWITGEFGTFRYGESAYFIESSRDTPKAEEIGGRYFSDYKKVRSIYIKKLGNPVIRFDIYRLKNLINIPERELCSFTKY